MVRTPIVWLTEERMGEESTVYSLQDLSILINEFLESSENAAVLLNGFEYLIVNHGFDSFIHFLQLTRSRLERHEAILIAPILEEALDLKERKLIEREVKHLIIGE